MDSGNASRGMQCLTGGDRVRKCIYGCVQVEFVF